MMSVGEGSSTEYAKCCLNSSLDNQCDNGCGSAECIQKGLSNEMIGDYLLISDGIVNRDPSLSIVHNEHFCGTVVPAGEGGIVSQASGPVVIRYVFTNLDLT